MKVDLIISSKKLFRVPLEDTDIYQIILELNYENIIVWTWEQRNYSSNSYNLSVFNIFFDTGLYVEIHYCNKEYEHIWKKMLADNMIKLMGHVLNNDLYHVVRYVFTILQAAFFVEATCNSLWKCHSHTHFRQSRA